MSQTAMEAAVTETRKDGSTDGSMPVVPAPRKHRSILVYLSIVWLVVLIAAAVFADLLPLASYATPVGKPRMTPQLGSLDLLLGTDTLGRSMLSRIVYGAVSRWWSVPLPVSSDS